VWEGFQKQTICQRSLYSLSRSNIQLTCIKYFAFYLRFIFQMSAFQALTQWLVFLVLQSSIVLFVELNSRRGLIAWDMLKIFTWACLGQISRLTRIVHGYNPYVSLSAWINKYFNFDFFLCRRIWWQSCSRKRKCWNFNHNYRWQIPMHSLFKKLLTKTNLPTPHPYCAFWWPRAVLSCLPENI